MRYKSGVDQMMNDVFLLFYKNATATETAVATTYYLWKSNAEMKRYVSLMNILTKVFSPYQMYVTSISENY